MKKSNVFFVLICFFLTYNVIAQPPPEKCKICGKLKVNCPYKGSHPYLSVYPEEIRISGNEYSSSISVESNRKWDVISNQPWILVRKTKNNFGNTFVDFTVKKNLNNTTREGYIDISTSDGTIKKRVKVLQLKDAGLDIKGVEFANLKDSLLSEYGDSLYAADIYYLSPRILYKSLNTRWNSNDTLFIKIIKPNGVISHGDSSPSGYSYFTLLKNCNCSQQSLSGWGSSKGGTYTPGVYTYEIWFCGNRIYSTNFTLYDIIDDENREATDLEEERRLAVDCKPVTDYDGNTYKTVQIGKQCWMSENLRSEHYADGASIKTYYRSYEKGTYGYNYDWYAVMYNDKEKSYPQGVCPKGWHVPNLSEWHQLIDYVSSQKRYVGRLSQTSSNPSTTLIAKALASRSDWNQYGDGTQSVIMETPKENNSTGFNAFPNTYNGAAAQFWTSAEHTPRNYSYYFSITTTGYVFDNRINQKTQMSVRCVRDWKKSQE